MKNKGAISIFALLSMMFFLIFIMVAYNNVMQKGKTQVEVEGILANYYKPAQTATVVASGNLDATKVSAENKGSLLKENAQQNSVSGNSGKYIYSNKKIYQVQ